MKTGGRYALLLCGEAREETAKSFDDADLGNHCQDKYEHVGRVAVGQPVRHHLLVGVEDGPVCPEYDNRIAPEIGDERQVAQGFAQEDDDERPAYAAEVEPQEILGQQKFVQAYGCGQQPYRHPQR